MTELKAPIVAATVYPDRARVTRRITTSLEAGQHRLEVVDLPLTLTPESLRASGRGTARARILGLDVSCTFYTEPPARDVSELRKRLEELQDGDKALADRAETLTAQLNLAKGLSASAAEHLSKGIGLGRSQVDDLAGLVSFVTSQMDEAAQALREVNVQRRKLSREINKLQQELDQLKAAQPTERYAASVDVEVVEKGDLELEITYVVKGARWQPLYDLRLSEAGSDGEPELSLTYLGEVSQQTGENWEEVTLSLSTAKPALSAILPELKPWYVRPHAPPQPMLSMKRAASAGSGVGLAAMAPDMAALMGAEMEEAEGAVLREPPAPPPVMEVEAVTAEVEDSGAAVTFKIGRPTSAPGDGSPCKTTVATLPLPPRLDYLTAPKLVSQTYRRATITNDTEYVLLPGRANIFHEGGYIGTTALKNVAPGQEFEVFLGVDERLSVERELVKREVDKKLLGNARRRRYAYRITVRNHRDKGEKVTVFDQIPVSGHENIKVKTEQVDPEPTEKTELGILKWELSLEPNEEQTIRFDFTIEHPRDMQVVGLL